MQEREKNLKYCITKVSKKVWDDIASTQEHCLQGKKSYNDKRLLEIKNTIKINVTERLKNTIKEISHNLKIKWQSNRK